MTLSIDKLSNVLLALGEPARLRLVALCQHGELTVKELTGSTGMSQPRVSRHLRILVEAGVLDRFRELHWVYYRLRFEGEEASLARAALARASAHEETLATDARRLGAVLAERAKELRTAATDGDGDSGVSLTPVAWSRIEGAVKRFAAQALGSHGLGDLLDVGTGTGRMLRILAADARRAEGIDKSPEMRYAARAALREAGLGNCSIRDGDMYELPYDDLSFDTVLVGHVLTCANEPWHAIREAGRVLKPSGHFLIMELLPDGLPVEAWCRSLAEWLGDARLEIVSQETLSVPGVTAVLVLSQREPPIERVVDLAIA